MAVTKNEIPLCSMCTKGLREIKDLYALRTLTLGLPPSCLCGNTSATNTKTHSAFCAMQSLGRKSPQSLIFDALVRWCAGFHSQRICERDADCLVKFGPYLWCFCLAAEPDSAP
jgi:hypothetical protein